MRCGLSRTHTPTTSPVIRLRAQPTAGRIDLTVSVVLSVIARVTRLDFRGFAPALTFAVMGFFLVALID